VLLQTINVGFWDVNKLRYFVYKGVLF